MGKLVNGIIAAIATLVNLPDFTVGASVPFAEMIASGMAT